MKTELTSKSIASTLATVLFLTMLHLLPGVTPSALANTTTLSLPAGANQSVASTFIASGTSSVTVSVVLTSLGTAGRDPAKNLSVALFKPGIDPNTGNPVQALSRLVNPGQSLTVSLTSDPSRTKLCSNWTVKVSNPNDNATASAATAKVNFLALLVPQTGTLLAFGLSQGQVVEKSISVPATGTETITATWVTDELVGLANVNFKLSFVLRRADGTRVNSDTGFGQNVIGTSEADKMKISHRVTALDLNTSGAWKIVVVGASEGKVKDVKITTTFVPSCN